MRIDCYNACENIIAEVECGDTFYYRGSLYMRVNPDILGFDRDDYLIVDLARGDLEVVKGDTPVIFADTKVVVNTKELSNEK